MEELENNNTQMLNDLEYERVEDVKALMGLASMDEDNFSEETGSQMLKLAQGPGSKEYYETWKTWKATATELESLAAFDTITNRRLFRIYAQGRRRRTLALSMVALPAVITAPGSMCPRKD